MVPMHLTLNRTSFGRGMRRTMVPAIGIGWLLAALVAARTCQGATLRAGVAKVDITPPGRELLFGYDNRLTPATGRLDPIYARVLVLEVGEKRVPWGELNFRISIRA